MKLLKLSASGFRSLKRVEVDFEALTVLIGENDAGKSSILDAINLVLDDDQPDGSDFYSDTEGRIVDQIEIVLEFELGEADIDARPLAIEDRLKIRKVYSRVEIPGDTFYWGEKPKDERLSTDFYQLKAKSQKDLIRDLEPSVESDKISNAEKRRQWFENYLEKAPKEQDWIEAPRDWKSLLPRFERYSAMDYDAPENMVFKTLKQVYERAIYEETSDDEEISARQLITPLHDVEIAVAEEMQSTVAELEDYIQKYDNRIQRIGYEPTFDFAYSLRSGEFTVDYGRGLHPLSKTGDGTKRRMFVAVLDWDREISTEQARSGRISPPIIRGYDEPDTNLHYDAQRVMYRAISDIVHSENSSIQAVLCTHSLTMIDRAPAQSIRLLSLDDSGCTTVDKLNTDDDPEIEQFLKEVARELGITNSIMFYERCFVLVEGHTEKNALPILYRRIYDRSLLEDGIRIINVKSNSAVREFLKLLERNRRDLVLIFIDSDSEDSKDANLTRTSLRNAGFSEKFIEERFIFIGDSEFEDAFCDRAIVRCLQKHWPKQGNNEWTEDEIAPLREESKFSSSLQRIAWEESGTSLRKPDLGRSLAELCPIEEIPQEIHQLFKEARMIAGLDI